MSLLITRLDWLARSTRDLLNVLDAVSKTGAGLRSLADDWADTTTPHGRLMLTGLDYGPRAMTDRGHRLAAVKKGFHESDGLWLNAKGVWILLHSKLS
jgi:Resolvase, N terminal domain